MALVQVTRGNIGSEHICCAISEKKGENCVAGKKAWLQQRFDDGLVFTKLDERGKVFIEYLPAENAWQPVDAAGYMHINCFWVSGRFKGQGYGRQLLESCVADAKAKGHEGLTVVAGTKKQPFLADGAYLKAKGFKVADTAEPYFELLYLPFEENAPLPTIKQGAKQGRIDEPGMVLYYTNGCPHSEKYAHVVQGLAAQRGHTLHLHKLETAADAQNAPCPVTTYAFFYNGRFLTQEIFSEKKFEKFLDGIQI